jgi:hypothetical protein
MRRRTSSVLSTKVVDNVIKVGLYCDLFNHNKTIFYDDQLQTFAAFKMAIDEINNRSDILPNTKLVIAMRGGHGAYDAVIASLDLATANFSAEKLSNSKFIGGTSQGVDVVVNTGDNDETTSINLMFANSKIVQLHTAGESHKILSP